MSLITLSCHRKFGAQRNRQAEWRPNSSSSRLVNASQQPTCCRITSGQSNLIKAKRLWGVSLRIVYRMSINHPRLSISNSPILGGNGFRKNEPGREGNSAQLLEKVFALSKERGNSVMLLVR